MSGFHGEIDPGDVGRRLQGFAVQMLDLRPFWPTAARIGRGWFREQFASEGAWGGEPWAPLSAATLAQKAANGQVLVESGALRRAALAPARNATPTMLELTVVDPKVGYHQYGTSKMPARPVVPPAIPQSAIAELEAAFDVYVNGVIERWGLR